VPSLGPSKTSVRVALSPSHFQTPSTLRLSQPTYSVIPPNGGCYVVFLLLPRRSLTASLLDFHVLYCCQHDRTLDP
jgi:hypothetical protein